MLKTQARLEEGLEREALSAEGVDDLSTRLDEGSLEHVREKREDAVQRLELGVLGDAAVGDASEELGQDGQVEDEGSGEEGVLEDGGV